ncbi:MAG: hypothetical protein R3181_07500 [Rubricoccaceae bacterium]|nr:hypothetical protein [Rubricoccaceae bacterium]
MFLTPDPTPTRPLLLVGALLLALAPAAGAQVCEGTQVYLTDSARTNYSLGYEHYKNEAWCDALPYLRWIIQTEPLFTSTTPDDRNFRRLMDTYEGIAETLEGDLRRTYLDSVLVVREQMQETLAANNIAYDERAQLLAEGLFYTEHFEEYPEQQDRVFDLYLEAHQMAPDSTDDYYLNEIGRMVSARAAAETMDPREARDFINEEVLPYADDPSYLEGIAATFQVDPIDQWESAYEEYQAGDRSEEVVNTVFAGLTQIDSLITERYPALDQQALKREVIPVLIEFNPTPDLLIYRGTLSVQAGRTEDGLNDFQRALEMAESNTDRLDIYYRIANTLYSEGQRGQAYDWAGRALQIDSGYGPALYIRALVVAGTLRGGSLQAAAGAWCVADMFSRAASAGGPTASRARQLAGRYAASGPSRDDYFFEGWRPGMRVTGSTGYGSCTTTVR